jgi:pimeloyl-ACP methyl ester carboxylesterase
LFCVNENFFIAKNGGRLYFEEFGQGDRTVVMPNGVTTANDFAQLADEFRVIAYDPRNRGRSDQSWERRMPPGWKARKRCSARFAVL